MKPTNSLRMMSPAFFLRVLILSVSLSVATSRGFGESAEELIRKGDVLSDKLQDTEALKLYLPAEKLDPNNVHLLVHISKAYRHLMSDAPGREQKLVYGGIAAAYAERAVALAPKDPEAQLALAISYGKVLPLLGSRQQFERSRQIKTAVDQALQLNPLNDLGWHILGRWYFNLASVGSIKRSLAQVVYGKVPPASYDDAVRCYQKAMELKPDRLMHYIELGCTYAEMGRKDEARKFITKGLGMAETEKDDPETKNKGRKALAKLR